MDNRHQSSDLFKSDFRKIKFQVKIDAQTEIFLKKDDIIMGWVCTIVSTKLFSLAVYEKYAKRRFIVRCCMQ